jgi:hypothetical protein
MNVDNKNAKPICAKAQHKSWQACYGQLRNNSAARDFSEVFECLGHLTGCAGAHLSGCMGPSSAPPPPRGSRGEAGECMLKGSCCKSPSLPAIFEVPPAGGEAIDVLGEVPNPGGGAKECGLAITSSLSRAVSEAPPQAVALAGPQRLNSMQQNRNRRLCPRFQFPRH